MATKKARNNPNFNRKAETGGFRRPNHVDFLTTEEHKKNKTTGVRKNDMALQYEFWILGEIVRTVSFAEQARDENALTKAHMRTGPPTRWPTGSDVTFGRFGAGRFGYQASDTSGKGAKMVNETDVGELTAVLTIDVPHEESYKMNRGDTERKNLQLFSCACTRDQAQKMTDHFRARHPGRRR